MRTTSNCELCCITHDSATYERAFARIRERSPELAGHEPEPAPALEVWTYMQPCPEPEKAIPTMGTRDVSHDAPPAPMTY